MQTKKQSFVESVTYTAIGFGVSLASSFVIFPLVGIETSADTNVMVSIYYTAISVVRSYVLRRYFNKKNTPEDTIKENPPKPPKKVNEVLNTYQKCCKKDCQQPAYDFGYCFMHYKDGEMRTGG